VHASEPPSPFAAFAAQLKALRRLEHTSYREMARRDSAVHRKDLRRVRAKLRALRLRINQAFDAMIRALARVFRLFDESDVGDPLTLSQTVGSHRSRAPGHIRNTSPEGPFRELAPV
jgi:hypothetical protein